MSKHFVIIISLLILALIIWHANPSLLVKTLLKANLFYVMLALIFSTISISIRVMKWQVLLNRIDFFRLFPIQVLGLTISNLTPGKIAEPAKAILLKLRSGTPVSASLISIIWERIIDIIILIVLAMLAIQLFSFGTHLFYIGILSIAIFIVLIILLLCIIISRRFGLSIFNFIKKLPILKMISVDFINTFYKTKIKKTALISCLLLTTLAWIMDGFVFYFAFLSLNINVSLLLVITMVALTCLISIASSLPGGLGSFEVVMILFLGLLGIEASIATAGVFLARLLTIWYSIFLGGLSFTFLSRKINMKELRNII